MVSIHLESRPYARSTNMIFQHLALFPHMNGLDNVCLWAKNETLERRCDRPKYIRRLAVSPRKDMASANRQLSAATKQRVAMARALNSTIRPFCCSRAIGRAGLQLPSADAGRVEAFAINRSATLYLLSPRSRAKQCQSDRIAVMGSGPYSTSRLTQRNIYEAPRTRFVARFCRHNQCV